MLDASEIQAGSMGVNVATGARGSYLHRVTSPTRLTDVIALILDRPLDRRAPPVTQRGLFTIDTRVDTASIETYLRLAELVNKLET
jgi:hypothetical protein